MYNTTFIIIVCIVIAVLSITYVLRNKIVLMMSSGLHIAFVLFISTAIISLFIPTVFNSLANYTLENMGTLTSIQDIDKSISLDTVLEPTQNVIDEITSWWPWNNTQENIQTNSNATQKTKGPLETNLYPSLVSFIENTYRIVTLLLSIIGMVVVIYASYATGNVHQIDRLEKRVKYLENLISPKQ
jgi:hypothetical protein